MLQTLRTKSPLNPYFYLLMHSNHQPGNLTQKSPKTDPSGPGAQQEKHRSFSVLRRGRECNRFPPHRGSRGKKSPTFLLNLAVFLWEKRPVQGRKKEPPLHFFIFSIPHHLGLFIGRPDMVVLAGEIFFSMHSFVTSFIFIRVEYKFFSFFYYSFSHFYLIIPRAPALPIVVASRALKDMRYCHTLQLPYPPAKKKLPCWHKKLKQGFMLTTYKPRRNIWRQTTCIIYIDHIYDKDQSIYDNKKCVRRHS